MKSHQVTAECPPFGGTISKEVLVFEHFPSPSHLPPFHRQRSFPTATATAPTYTTTMGNTCATIVPAPRPVLAVPRVKEGRSTKCFERPSQSVGREKLRPRPSPGLTVVVIQRAENADACCFSPTYIPHHLLNTWLGLYAWQPTGDTSQEPKQERFRRPVRHQSSRREPGFIQTAGGVKGTAAR